MVILMKSSQVPKAMQSSTQILYFVRLSCLTLVVILGTCVLNPLLDAVSMISTHLNTRQLI